MSEVKWPSIPFDFPFDKINLICHNPLCQHVWIWISYVILTLSHKSAYTWLAQKRIFHFHKRLKHVSVWQNYAIVQTLSHHFIPILTSRHSGLVSLMLVLPPPPNLPTAFDPFIIFSQTWYRFGKQFWTILHLELGLKCERNCSAYIFSTSYCDKLMFATTGVLFVYPFGNHFEPFLSKKIKLCQVTK